MATSILHVGGGGGGLRSQKLLRCNKEMKPYLFTFTKFTIKVHLSFSILKKMERPGMKEKGFYTNDS